MLPNPRYERKLVPAGLSLPEVLALVSRHPAGFRRAYPDRIVNNLYLDTPSLGAYREHVNGASWRVKTRIRWYGRVQGEILAPVLEQKVKSGQVSGKTSVPLPSLAVNGGGPKKAFDSFLHSASCPEHVRLPLLGLESSLGNSYGRSYFISGDKKFRLTVDSQLSFARPQDWRAAETLSLVIIEVKYAPQDSDDAALVTNAFPFRVRRCSKYLLGIQALGRG